MYRIFKLVHCLKLMGSVDTLTLSKTLNISKFKTIWGWKGVGAACLVDLFQFLTLTEMYRKISMEFLKFAFFISQT